MFKNFISTFIFILVFASISFCQSSSEQVQTGFNNYQNGDYQAALMSFNAALQSSSTEINEPLAEESNENYIRESQKKYTDESEKQYMETSSETYTGISKREKISTETKKYESTPLEYQGDEPAKIYLYRGRTYLQLGNKQAALNDFDKAVSLDPTLSEVFFRRALANMEVDPDKACPDLLAAIERGHQSAKELYDLICKEE
ncbi:MAG: tetratricopeptide repeat protein [Ignavibacteriaceae bacterium]|nr:tetratricopeptide repeat protein [Ignavibacteriaceae bacterium]